MKEITLDEKKALLVEMLKKIDNYLSRNSIRYFVYYGTLLGTIRHQGFIPWDDDIDLVVPREDYFKLIHLMEKDEDWLKQNNMELVSYNEVERSYYKRFKIADTRTEMIEYGKKRSAVFLDFFPLDYISGSKFIKLKQKVILKLDNVLVLCYRGQAYGHGIKKVIYGLLIGINKLLRLRRMLRFYEKLLLKLENRKPCYASVPEGGDLYVYSFDTHKEMIKLPFETLFVPVPIGYDTILRERYGDYMQMPPENERCNHDGYKMYWKES